MRKDHFRKMSWFKLDFVGHKQEIVVKDKVTLFSCSLPLYLTLFDPLYPPFVPFGTYRLLMIFMGVISRLPYPQPGVPGFSFPRRL